MTELGTCTGRVLDEQGKGLADVAVNYRALGTLETSRVRTSTDGHFQIRRNATSLGLTFYAPGYGLKLLPHETTEKSFGDVVLKQALPLQFTVMDSTETPFVEQPAGRPLDAITNKQGYYKFSNLKSGDYTLYFLTGHGPPENNQDIYEPLKDFKRSPSQSFSHKFSGATIKGQITNQDNRPLPSIEIRYFLEITRNWQSVISNANCQFSIQATTPLRDIHVQVQHGI